MTYRLLSADLVDAIHDSILSAGDLRGRAGDKSLDAALARVDNRLAYGLISDIFDLAAANTVAIARGQCFNDGNKRTAFQCMDICLDLNGRQAVWDVEAVGDMIVRVAQGGVDEADLAEWLRTRMV